MVVRRLSQHLTECGNVAVEITLLHHCIGPDILHQFFLYEDLARVFHEGQENVEALGSER
jgi:hypothetical protein